MSRVKVVSRDYFDSIFPPPPSGTIAQLYSATVTLTDAQIKALPTTAVEIVPAPGDGRVIVPLACLLGFHIVSSYTMDAGSTLQLMLGTREVSGIVQMSYWGSQTGDDIWRMPMDVSTNPDSDPFFGGMLIQTTQSIDGSATNTALKIKDDFNGVPDYTGGDSANTLTVTVLYMVADVS